MSPVAFAFALWSATQEPARANEPVVLNAGIGGCSAEFTVTGPDGQPVYAALIRTKVRYGFMSVKRMELEISTAPDGRAKIQGLPAKGEAVVYHVVKGPDTGTATHDLKKQCNATFTVALSQQPQ